MKRLILFDCDGTLVDSQHMIVEAMTNAFLEHGRKPLPREKALSIVGLSLPLAIEVLLNKQDEETDSISQSFKNHYHAIRQRGDEEPLYPHARMVIEKLYAHEGFVLGVATGKNMRGLKHVLAMHQLDYAFKTLQTADNAKSKPHPQMVHQAMVEVDCQSAIMIGDTSYDMLMAKAAGAYAIGVTWGYHTREELEKAGADVIVDNYKTLYDIICAHYIPESPFHDRI